MSYGRSLSIGTRCIYVKKLINTKEDLNTGGDSVEALINTKKDLDFSRC